MTIANVLMIQNMEDYPHVRELAKELDVEFTIDPTITPKMDGDRGILNRNIEREALHAYFTMKSWWGTSRNFAASRAADEDEMDSLPCSAGHTACYVSPYGDVYPCVQFPLPTGTSGSNALWISGNSEQMNEVGRFACAICLPALAAGI